MTIYAALLRAVNVGGTGLVSMAALRETVEGIGFKNVRTLLQSGNLAFDAGSKSSATVETSLEAAFEKAFGFKTDIYVRSGAELAEIIAHNPFAKEAKSDPARLHVLFMRKAPAPTNFKALEAAIKGGERVRGGERHAYLHYPDGAGASKLTAAMIARHLGTPGTARNWNTVTKLAALAHSEK
jgi:uncharacterized protein (DUF1697 family)